MRRSRCFVFDLSLNLRDSYSVKTKAYKNALYHMYVCPTSAHRGFRYGYRRHKGNNFISESVLFCWQNLILWHDLTLLNINMSKNSTFAIFFLLKSLYYQWLFVSLQHENPPSLSTMLKCAGRFLRPLPPRFKHVLLNCGSIFAVIYC